MRFEEISEVGNSGGRKLGNFVLMILHFQGRERGKNFKSRIGIGPSSVGIGQAGIHEHWKWILTVYALCVKFRPQLVRIWMVFISNFYAWIGVHGTSKSINQSINQTIESSNQSIKQSIGRSIKCYYNARSHRLLLLCFTCCVLYV